MKASEALLDQGRTGSTLPATMSGVVSRLSREDSVMAYIPQHARLFGLESTDWLVLLVGIALAGLLTIALEF
jgi:hypothetical protein